MNIQEIDAHLTQMTPHQLKIIQAVYNGGGAWMTRSNVAKALGKRRLTPYDINCLNLLSDRGIIETSTQPTTAPGSDFAYIYHMPDRVADVLQRWSDQRQKQVRVHHRKPINLVSE